MAQYSFSQQEYEAFRKFLEEACGIVLGDNKHYLVDSRLRHLMEEHSIPTLGELVANLNDNSQSSFRDRIVDAMTTNETSWFRDGHPFDALHQLILPELAKQKPGDLRIWSSACSSGQEPYSISMVIQEFMSAWPGAIGAVQIIASDISPSMLKSAREATYEKSVVSRGLSPERLQRHFRQVGSKWKVKPELCSRISFREINLMKDFSFLGRFDVVFCRNVLIYFSPAMKNDIIQRLHKALKPGGYLLLGGTESMTGFSDCFETVRFNNGLLCKVKEA